MRLTLLDRAAALVFDRGVDALSLRRLAAEAHTSTTAVYSLFGNKAGLLDSLYREAARRFAARLATVGVTDDPAADVLRLGVAYRDYALTDPHLYSIMFTQRTADLDLDLDLGDEPGDEAAQTIQPLVEAVRRGQRAGRFADVPAERIALCCWGIAHGLVSLELTGNLPPGLDIEAGYEDALRAMIIGWAGSR
ncbi:MAG: TetR family transcriptional regulator [Actinophytocola sp.]|uniref:TetR/AcrR family transcriptional regulator n=1 Tax=Actinophytocola sp. TaxID=1872138 RepID=UPI00132744D9|nr:TetR/AcrR family transcriptional regulator [Actinophytocola sp.]MPZ83276.1 TetR family transcriptional regulator [Actinophytocola sp.]